MLREIHTSIAIEQNCADGAGEPSAQPFDKIRVEHAFATRNRNTPDERQIASNRQANSSTL